MSDSQDTTGDLPVGEPPPSGPASFDPAPPMPQVPRPPEPGQSPYAPAPPSAAPQYGQPQYGQPQYGQPQYGQPQYGQPQYGQPQYPGVPGGPTVYGQQMLTLQPASSDLGTAFSWASATFQRFLGSFCLSGLIYLMLLIAGLIAMYVGMFAILLGGGALLETGGGAGAGSAAPSFAAVGLIAVVYGGMVAMMTAIQTIGTGYMASVASSPAEGREPNVGAAFGDVRWGSLFGASILASLITFVGLLACVIPGILISLVVPFVAISVVDGKQSATDSIREVWELTKANPGPVLLGGLIAMALSMAGAMACYIGMIATLPLSQLLLTHIYRGLKGEQIAYWPPKV